jgi:signal transduction histidine kinase
MAAQERRRRGPERTVLIADDDRTLAKAIAATLDLDELQTVVAHDGDQALALGRSLRPDLILLGVMMPGKSGIEVCATLKTDPVTASIPVIFITAKTGETDRMVGIAAGADDYLTKPFSPTELIALVRKVLAGRPVEPHLRQPVPSATPADQLVIYARELRELFEREQGARQALEEARWRLDELDRLKAAFIGAVTHELLTPFAAIGLALQVLECQAERLQPDQRDALDTLGAEIAALHRLVTGVVKFAQLVNKRREPQPAAISLSRVIPWAVQPAAALAQARGTDFQVLVPPELPKVYADPELLGEAVFQMAHNAVKFNRPGGQAQVRAFESEGCVVIEVADTGVGLTADQMALLGQPFEQSADALRRGREGLGVGWAFVRYVAEAHGGWTRVASLGPGQGSTFSLTVPVATPAQEPGAACRADMGKTEGRDLSSEEIVVELCMSR